MRVRRRKKRIKKGVKKFWPKEVRKVGCFLDV